MLIDIEAFVKSGVIMTTRSGRLAVGWGRQAYHEMANESHDNAHYQFYFPDFFLSKPNPWITCEHCIEIGIDELAEYFPQEQHSAQIHWIHPDFDQFAETFVDLQSRFLRKELHKAVPFAMEISKTSIDSHLLRYALHHLLTYAKSQPVYVYGHWCNHHGILGATPELLFRLKQEEKKTLQTMACAGTRSACQGNPEALLNDRKDRYEHHLVVQGIMDALSPYGVVTADHVHLLQLPGLYHLVTPIKVELQAELPFHFIVNALHPTPALGAWPRQTGWEWLECYQQQIDRKHFGAPVGFVGPLSDACCYVAIRNVQWSRDGMAIAAGCGVVSESQLEVEWKEIQSKIHAIKKILGL